MDFTKTIETERLILRKFTNDDINDVYKNYASKDVVTEFLTWETHSSIDVTTEYISNVVIPSYENEEYNWAVEYKETHEVVGAIMALWGEGGMFDIIKEKMDSQEQKTATHCACLSPYKQKEIDQIMLDLDVNF